MVEEKDEDENENENDRIGSGNRSVEHHGVEMEDVIGNGDGDSRVYDVLGDKYIGSLMSAN